MSILVDLIIVVVVLLCTYYGLKKGFVITFFNAFGGIVSFVISAVLAKPIGNFLSDLFLKKLFSEHYQKEFFEYFGASAGQADSEQVFSSASEYFTRYGVDQSEIQGFFATSGNSTERFIDKTIEAAISPMAESIGYIIGFILISVLCFLVFKFLVRFFDLITRLPILHISNTALGIVCGFCYGLLISVAFCFVLLYLDPVLQSSDSSFFNEFSMNDTVVARFLSNFIFI